MSPEAEALKAQFGSVVNVLQQPSEMDHTLRQLQADRLHAEKQAEAIIAWAPTAAAELETIVQKYETKAAEDAAAIADWEVRYNVLQSELSKHLETMAQQGTAATPPDIKTEPPAVLPFPDASQGEARPHSESAKRVTARLNNRASS